MLDNGHYVTFTKAVQFLAQVSGHSSMLIPARQGRGWGCHPFQLDASPVVEGVPNVVRPLRTHVRKTRFSVAPRKKIL